MLLPFEFLALIAHAFSLYRQLLTLTGLALDFFNATNLIAVAVILLTLLATLRIPAEDLLLPLFPPGASTTLLVVFIPHNTVESTNGQPGILAHILLSTLAYGPFTIAVFRALLLLLQDYHLKHKHSSGLIRNFLPLQTMESLLLGFLWGSWSLFPPSLPFGRLSVNNLLAQHLTYKTILSYFVWMVFVVFPQGHHQLGWRGHKAVRWTLAGFCLLILAYFGSKLVQEFILHI